MAGILQMTNSDAFSWEKKLCIYIQILLKFVPRGSVDNKLKHWFSHFKFHWRSFPRLLLIASQHCFIHWQARSHHPNQWDPGPHLNIKMLSYQQSVKKLFSASLLFSKQNRPPFHSWHNHDFHINNFIHFIHVVKQMHKMSEKYLKKNTKLAWKVFFWSPVSFSKSIFNYEWGSGMPSCNITPYQWCVYWLLGFKWRPAGGTQNKQRASVRLYWLSSPLTACRPPKYPVSASGLQSIQFRPPYLVGRFLMLCLPVRKSHCGDKMILRPSYLHNGISCTDKTISLYWIRALLTGSQMHHWASMRFEQISLLGSQSQWWKMK